ncbi:MAG: hypothetical protein J6D00_00580, partial [Christensenellaceae bacterium]|nr:hypothetical protein [Christensenellaceae bacterium]
MKTAAAAMVFSCGACVGKIMSVPDVSFLEKELALGQKALQKHDENAAAKLILQNQFGIRQALSKIKKEKKTKFPTETPKKGEFCGLSRPQILAETYLETGDISRESFREFLSAYAENKNLMAHEFALLPCFLRLAGLKLLLEIMRKIACPEKQTSEKERILLWIRQENSVKTVFSAFALADELKNDLLWQCSKTAQLLMHDPSFMQLDPEQRLSLVFKLSEIAAKFGVKEYFAAQKLIELSRGSDVFSYVFGEKRDEWIKSFGKKLKTDAKREAYFFFTWILPLAVAVLNGNFWLIFPVFVLLRALANSLFPVFCRAEKRILPVLAEMPENERTLITISAMLKGNAAELAQKLQLRYLANKHEGIAAALLLDFAGKEDEKEAEKLFSIIAEMNAAENGHPYYAFIRKKMPAKDGSFCAWERKRGAILELCALTLGKETKSEFLYSALPEGVRRLILLDEDTEPMPGSLEKLIRCAAHPLNRPVVENGKLICGRVLISPLIGTHLLLANRSFFTKMFGRNAGVDRYSQQRSELLFDLFGKTDFCGKGIVDIEAFYALFWGKFPEERILSHDHIEGLIGNAGYFSGTAMFEGLPKNLISFEKRGHRWLRGDIQQLPFLPVFPFAEKLRLISCMLGGFEKPAAMVLLFAVLSREIHPIVFIVLAFGKSLLPLIAALKNRETVEARLIFSEAFFSFAVLPYTAMMANDAIMRSLYRLFISKKKLLEWTTAKDSEKRFSAVSYYREMWPNLLMAVICLFTVPILAPIFAFAPLLGYFSAKERKEKQSDPEWLRQAYPIWRFFLENRLENGFLPDNIQISPKRSPAMRTSPTNAAYCLLAPLIAAKLGFVPWEWAKAETEKLIAALERMEKWHGHLYNWYALPDMQILQPAFISSVDSGNLACACLAAAEMLKGDAPLFSAENLITALSIKDPYLKKLAQSAASADEKERLRSFAIISIYTEKKGKDDENIRLFGEDIKRFFIAERMQTDGKALTVRLFRLFSAMDFSVLYNKKKKLLSIGYDVEKGMLSSSYYDLFSSEAKQSYYAAIIKGDIPPEAWFALDRSLIRVKNGFAAASWSGTMFEFLMPALLLPVYEGSFARENIENAAYEQLAVSPGISESGYYAFDRSLSYQYKAFGLKKLAYRNEPDDELVYAPYAAMLALPYHEKAVEKALGFYRDMAMQGKYGFFEAIDMRKKGPRRVMSYMVHHMGMSLSAIYNYITGGELQKSLMKNPNAAAFSLLLMEKRPPRNTKTDEIGEKTLKTE